MFFFDVLCVYVDYDDLIWLGWALPKFKRWITAGKPCLGLAELSDKVNEVNCSFSSFQDASTKMMLLQMTELVLGRAVIPEILTQVYSIVTLKKMCSAARWWFACDFPGFQMGLICKKNCQWEL